MRSLALALLLVTVGSGCEVSCRARVESRPADPDLVERTLQAHDPETQAERIAEILRKAEARMAEEDGGAD